MIICFLSGIAVGIGIAVILIDIDKEVQYYKQKPQKEK